MHQYLQPRQRECRGLGKKTGGYPEDQYLQPLQRERRGLEEKSRAYGQGIPEELRGEEGRVRIDGGEHVGRRGAQCDAADDAARRRCKQHRLCGKQLRAHHQSQHFSVQSVTCKLARCHLG